MKLKQNLMRLMFGVAPLVGAWNETYLCMKRWGSKPVAPLVGAWIET